MGTSYPGGLDTFAALVDNTDSVIAAHPNDRGDSIEQLQIKVGVDSSAVVTSHDYKLTHLPAQVQNWDAGAYEVRGLTLESDVATGTAPIAVASTTLVSNLNVEKLNSQVGSYYVNIANATIASEAQGDILYRGAAAWARLGTGTAGQLLKSGGAGANPSWATAGKLVQQVNTLSGAVSTGTTVMPYDDTIPVITEGDEYMTRAITPTSASNKLRIDIIFYFSHTTAGQEVAGLFQDTTTNALAVGSERIMSASNLFCIQFTHHMTAGTASETTFRLRAGHENDGTTTTFNGTSSARKLGGVLASSITITEILV